MKEIYRKRGSVARWENGTIVRAVESGIATEEGETFECRPADDRPSNLPSSSGVENVARAIEAVVGNCAVRLERLIVVEGTANHEFGETRWSDVSRRVHLSLARERLRVMVDLGSFEIDAIQTIAAALARCEPNERPAPRRLRLSPPVSAALLPSFFASRPPDVNILQSGGGYDGKGERVEEVPIVAPPWPNWYRPSYRVRAVRMPLNVRVECSDTTVDEEAPFAIALLAPPDGTLLTVLVQERERVFPATVRVSRIAAVGHERVWYPYAAGSFGAEMML